MSESTKHRSYVVDVIGIIVLYAIAMGAIVIPLRYFGIGNATPSTTVQAKDVQN